MKASSKFDVLLKSSLAKKVKDSDHRKILHILTKEVQKDLSKWKPGKKATINSSKPPYQVIDFFSGCGGMSLGFAALSKIIPVLEIVGACDIDEDALKTYERNFDAPGIRMDIRKIVGNEVALSQFLKRLPRYDIRRKTILIGCAPCQGFTSHRKKTWHLQDNRNTLVGAFASVAVKLNPECIVIDRKSVV
jgi:DNA (cytosine-5)-methyltransferase 1